MTNLFLGPKAKQITARGQKCHLGQGPQQWSFSRYVDEVPSRTISEGIKYSNQEYTRVGYPILGYFRVQVPENLCQTSLSSFKLARKFSSKLGT